MSFEVGRLSAALTLEGVDQFHRELDSAGQKLQEAGQKGASFGKAAEAAVRTAAGATTGLVTAAGAYLTILTKQGVAYNSLQQNSRAALSVLLGGTEKANAQMAKLDDFARNSPFSKSVFIEAQQQLIGFGMEAGKVIPTLDAVQQSMAAMGRGNEDISEVVRILAQVQSTGKITAETLNQLGVRGVDAATLIGEGMGKTGAEIREAITEGAIDGRKAIDLLVDGMQDRFGGAADNVKQQWSGAVDRIKAANRDIGAAIAEPFVSAEGGGMAVTWGNQVADVLRAIEKHATPVMSILTQRGMPFFASLTEGLDSSAQAIARWNPASLEQSLDRMSGHAPGIAALAGAVLALGAQVGPLGKVFEVLNISLNPAVAAFVGLAAASPEVRAALSGLLEAGKPLLPVVGELATILSNSLNSALPLVTGGVELLTGALEVVAGVLDGIPTPVIVGVGAFIALHKAMGPLEGVISGTASGLSDLVDTFKDTSARAYAAGLSEASSNMAGISEAALPATDAVKGLGNTLKNAFIANPIGIALTVIATAIGAWAMANAAAQQKVEEHRARVAELKGTLDEASGALTGSTRDMVAQSVASDEMAESLKQAGVSGQLYTQALIDGGAAAQIFESDLVNSAKVAIETKGKTDQLRETADLLGVSYETLIKRGLGYKDSFREVYDALGEAGSKSEEAANSLTISEGIMNGAIGTHKSVSESYREMRDSIEEAQREQQRIREATREAEAAMSDFERSNQRMNDALAIARDVTADATERLSALKQALNELNGGTKSQADLTQELNDRARSLADAFNVVDEHGNKLASGLVLASGEIDTTTAAGSRLRDEVTALNDEMLTAILQADESAKAQGRHGASMEEAAAAAEPYLSKLRTIAEEAGVSEPQVAALVKTMMSSPEMISFMVDDSGTVDASQIRLMDLAMQIRDAPNGEFEVTSDSFPGLMKALELLGIDITTLPDGTVKVKKDDGSFASVEEAINHVARARESLISFRVQEEWQGIPYKLPSSDSARGNLFTGGTAEAFAAGGFASGFYKAPPGQAAIHKFAESFLPWEAYISPLPGHEERNAKIAIEALRRLGFPVVPANQVYGTRAFAAGEMLANDSAPNRTQRSVGAAKTAPVSRQSRRNTGPLVGNIYLGKGATRSELDELLNVLDFYERSNR